jgi:transcriptional accessory protein Tex/SPT6
VISVDQDRKRIGLSIRQLQKDPWIDRVEKLKEGMLIEGTITHLTKFGAFARLDEELEGLIHVSELSEQRVGHPKEVVHEGDVVTLRVIKVDPERRRIGLSLRKVDSPAYADFDWKMALAEEVGKTQDDEEAVDEEVVDEEVVDEVEPMDVLEPAEETTVVEPVDEVEPEVEEPEVEELEETNSDETGEEVTEE